MAPEPRASSAELVGLFESESLRVLQSLEVTPRLQVRSTIRNYGKAGWEEVRPAQIDNWFDAAVTFESSAVTGRFWFGDRESYLTAAVARPRDAYPFALWEWANAVGVDGAQFGGEDWVYQPERVLVCVRAFGEGLQQLHDAIVGADDAVLARLEAARQHRNDAEREYWRHREQERDEAEAAIAFRAKDFARTSLLLGRHREHLSDAQKTKLALADQRSGARPT